MTLADSLRRHDLGLNAVRLGLAFLVLVSHTWPLGGYGPDPRLPGNPGISLGDVAVAGFFALSGLLVTRSGARRSARSFLMARLLRVYPAYIAVLLVSAAVLAPVIFALTHGSTDGYLTAGPGGPVAYIVHNAGFPNALQYGIHDVFATTTPYGQRMGGSVINGSLWSLPLEVRCYVIALAVVALGRITGTTRTTLVALVTGGVLFVLHIDGHASIDPLVGWLIPPDMLDLVLVFLCGAVVGSLADRMVLDAPLVAGAAAVFAGSALISEAATRTAGFGALCILLPALAAALPSRGLGPLRSDLSYGCYLWAFPVQMTVAHLGWNTSPVGYLLASAALTLGVAWLSWRLVEAPALALKHRWPSMAPTRSPRSDAQSLTDVAAGAPA